VAKEILKIGQDTDKVKIISIDEARIKMKLLINDELKISLHFGSFISRFPTKVSIKNINKAGYAYIDLETSFKENEVVDVIHMILEKFLKNLM
jgi:hypothetical protein